MRAWLRISVLCFSLLALAGCGRVRQGVQETITHGAEKWDACSLNVWRDYYTGSPVLHFVDVKGKAHELADGWRIDVSNVPCFN